MDSIPQPRKQTEQTGVSMEDVLKLIAKMGDQQHAQMLEAIKELKKPNQYEQAKLDKEEALLKAKQEQRLKLATIEVERKEMQKRNCSHTRPDGRHTWVAQVNADGKFRPMCLICQTVLPAIQATPEQLTQGVNLDAYHSLDIHQLEKLAAV